MFSGLLGLVLNSQYSCADDLRKNVVVLVDSSRSVDSVNRDSALRLVGGLVTGKVEEAGRSNWEFKPAASAGYPVATINLQRLMQGSSEPTQPIALPSARVVIDTLGNYARVAGLRTGLAQARTASPADISMMLNAPSPPFESSDNSTHISLAEAVVAKSFLAASSAQPYYLVVISDFHEDCFNRPISDYLDKIKSVALDTENQKVLRGEKAFNDGGGADNHKYSPDDVEAIRFLHDKTRDLLLGEFIYKGTPMPQAPVNVKVYSPMVKRGMEFTDQSVRWVLPDPAPGFSIAAEGLEMSNPLEVTIRNQDNQSERTIKETCGLVLARNRLDLGLLMERPEVAEFMVPGSYEITLGVPGDIGLHTDTKASLQILKPRILFADEDLQKSSADKPFEFTANREIKDEKIIVRLDPPPTQPHQITLKFGAKSVGIEVRSGSGEAALGDLLEKAGGADAFKLTAELALPPTTDTIAKDAWIQLPEISLWAVYEGAVVEGGAITLDKARALTLKASHAGMEGMDWRGTSVVSADNRKVAMGEDDDNNLDFSELPAGRYVVLAKFGSVNNPVSKELSVVIPRSIPWMPIAVISMLVLSLGLFAWHFFRR